MATNYGLDGTQSVNFHYKVRLISSYQNKLFYNIFSKGVIPESGNLIVVDGDGDTSVQGIQVKIPSGFSFFISPNNRYKTGVIQDNFNSLSALEQNIIEEQILKCDIVKDFYVQPKIITGTTDTTTKTIISPDHGFSAGDIVFIKTGESAGLVYGNRYRVMPGVTEYNFQISEFHDDPINDEVFEFTINADITIIQAFGGWLVAEYNYLEFSDLPVEFSVVTGGTKPTDNKVVLGEIAADPVQGYIQSINITQQDKAALSPNIYYEMNVDRIDGYHAGNESGHVALSNSGMCSGLNAEMINGYSEYQAAKKWEHNSGLNVEYVADEFGRFFQPGNSSVKLPLSNTLLNNDLNAEFVGGSGYTSLESAKHTHSMDYITEGPTFKRPLNVNVDQHLTHDSFKTRAIAREKIHNECFFARNDDLGGIPMIVTGQETLTANYSHISFDPEHQFNASFLSPPDIMIQIIDTLGDFGAWSHVKVKAADITPTHFTVEYTGYSGVDTGSYSGVSLVNLVIQYVAMGYGKSV